MADSEAPEFLGRGWGFPPRFLEPGREVRVAEGEEDIRQSLLILLGTRPGERPMHPAFGCGLNDFVFDLLDESLRTEIADVVERAVLFFEPRISLEAVAVHVDDPAAGRLSIHLDYRIRATNTRSNLVYPFYVHEGTNLPVDPGTSPS